MADNDRTECAQEGCSESHPNHRWGRTKAEGWFQQKDGHSWCPSHTPEWVAVWRARKAQ